MSTDPNVSKLRWLLTEAASNVGLVLTVNMINRVCAEEDRIMREDDMILMWQRQVDEAAAEMEPQP